MPVNDSLVLTIDLEDWFHCLEPDQSRWPCFERRAHIGTGKLLELLTRTGSHATFFVLGDVALAQPEVIERIVDCGHEIGSHGMYHNFVSKQSAEEFESDLVKSLDLLRRIAGAECTAYRAPYFSITRKMAWAFDILKRNGITTDSSIFPVRNPRYGDPGAPRRPYEALPGFWEWPIPALPSPVGNVPIGGGVGPRARW